MAEDGDAEPHEGSEPAPRADRHGTTAPPREKPIIEGAALSATGTASTPTTPLDQTETSPEEAPDLAANPAANPAAMGLLSGPAAPTTELPPAAPPEPARQRANRWLVAGAIVVGALIIVGGALGLHHLDNTPESLAALESRMAALEQTAQSLPRLQDAIGALDKRIGILEAGAQVSNAALAGLQQRLQQVQTALTQAVAQTVAKDNTSGAAASAPAQDLGPLNARIAKLEQRLAALDQQQKALAADLHGVQTEKNAAAQAAAAHARADALALLSANLRHELENGEPFNTDLAALAAHGADKAYLAKLAPFAAVGAPTSAGLAKQWSALEPAFLGRDEEPKANGFLGRLAQDAAHLVRIRKIGDTKGNDLGSHLARLSAALTGGRLDEAWREWSALPERVKAKSGAFGDLLRQRIEAEEAAKAMESDALAALAKSKS